MTNPSHYFIVPETVPFQARVGWPGKLMYDAPGISFAIVAVYGRRSMKTLQHHIKTLPRAKRLLAQWERGK